MPHLLRPPVSLQNMTQAQAAVSPFLLHLHFTPRLADPHNTALITTLLWCCDAAHTRDRPSSGSVHTVTSVSCCPSPCCHPVSREIATIMRQSYKKVCRKVKSQRERETPTWKGITKSNKQKETTEGLVRSTLVTGRAESQELLSHWCCGHPCLCRGRWKMASQQHQGEAPTSHRGFC